MISGKRKTQSELYYNDDEEQIVYKSARRIEKKRPSENRSPGSSGSSLSSHSSVGHVLERKVQVESNLQKSELRAREKSRL
jgi:hypothetical protein